MNKYLYISILILISDFFYSQKHFHESKRINYISIPILNTEQLKPYALQSKFNFKKIKQLSNLTIKFSCQNHDEPLYLFIYNRKKLVQKIKIIDHSYPMAYPEKALVADINNDSLLDIKLVFPNPGCGLAGDLSTKVYLFKIDSISFNKIEFFDFASEPEYDINGDSIYEIISCNHIQYNNHSYWVYNSYNYKNEKIINTSFENNYPLWTRHLNYSINKLALGIKDTIRRKYAYKYPIYK